MSGFNVNKFVIAGFKSVVEVVQAFILLAIWVTLVVGEDSMVTDVTIVEKVFEVLVRTETDCC